MNLNLLIEIKKEYTDTLLELLTPRINEGFEHIYKKAKQNTNDNNVLKVFQKLIVYIPKWSEDTIRQEYKRIISKTKVNWLVDLIKAVIKANIQILTVNNIPKNIYDEINIYKFLHTIYIESAKRIYKFPFLYYHKYDGIDIKRNEYKIDKLIKESIISSIRKILPMKIILNKYLGNVHEDTFNFDISKDNFKNTSLLLDIETQISDTKYIENINNNSENNNNLINHNNSVNNNNSINHNNSVNNNSINHNNSNMVGGNISENSNIDIKKKLLNIIDNNIKLTDSNDIFQKIDNKENNSSSTLKKIIQQSINKSIETKSASIDTNIKKKMENNLADSDSLTYNQENTQKDYQDIFSNSDIKNSNGIIENDINTIEKHEKKERDDFFTNYLNI